MSESKEPDEVTQQSDPTDAANGAGKFILDVPKLGLVAAPDLMHHTESAVENIKPEDIMLGMKHVSISSTNPPKHVLNDVSGFVVKGGITAILGGSSSGKSLLMKYLTGRVSHLEGTGEVTLNGKPFFPNRQKNGFGFVPQEDFLIGDITVRETFEIALSLRKNLPEQDRKEEADRVIKALGLGRVGDNVVGTILKRGLSGGEKRRCSVGNELVVRPQVLFLDEPTSGLDGTAAFEVIKTIRELADGSGGAFSVLLSIHQPNTRILSLFDHVLLLGNGGSVFFGSLHEAMVHFAEIGYECPENENPTDHILQVTDQSFARAEAIPRDFCQEYATSDMCKQMLRKLAESRALRASHWDADDDEEEHTRETTFGMQYWTLTKREAILAVRDPTLYYLQMVLHVVYGFMIGAVFWDLHPRLDDTLNYIPGASLWALMLCSYVHVFKIFYMVTANKRYEHERANASYGPVAFWLSELTVTFISQIIFIPGPLIAFYMIGFPASSYPWYLLVLTSAGMCAESMLNFISKFTENPAYAVVASQAVLVMLTVFGGGVFVPMNDIPGYWNWLAQLGVFTQGSQALMLRIFEGYNYVCPDGAIQGDSCVSGLATFPCDGEGTDLAAGVCEVSGITVIDINNGIAGDYWEYLGYLIVLFIMFRILVLILYIYPYKKIVRSLRKLTASYAQMAVLELQMDVKRLRGEVTALNTAVAKQGQFALPAYDPEIADDEVALLQGGDEEEGKAAHLMRARSSFDVRVPVFLTFEDVLVTLPTNGKVLIDSVSGFAESGHVLALMGPSGAGKTTLLNALSGRATYADVGGKVKLGSRPLSTDDLDYVPQFDSLNEAFTVTEILMYMAKLRTVGKGKRRRVLELINILGLTNKADFFIRDLSGGEKKRVSIGMGLVTQPPALFLDEPTTGLDSAAAYSVVKYINSVAFHTQTCVIMTIHQPSGQVFEMCENLMLLERGRLAYFGKRESAKEYFAQLGAACPPRTNPADVYADLVFKEPILSDPASKLTWTDLYKNSGRSVPLPICGADGTSCREADLIIRPGPGSVFMTLLLQMTVSYWRDVTVYWLRLLELIIVAFYVGTIFFRLDLTLANVVQFSGAAFFNTWCVLFAVIAATPAFVEERRIALAEMLNGAYSAVQYCSAQFVSSLPYNLVISLIFQGIFHFLVGFHDTFEAYIYASLLTFSLLLMMEALMLIVVEVIKNAMLSTTFSMVLLGTLFLFPGFFVKTSDMSVAIQWLSYMMPTRYAFQGQLFNIFDGQTYESGSGGISGSTILDIFFDVPADLSMWGMWAIVMFGYTMLFRLVHYAAVMYTVYPYLKSSRISSSTDSKASAVLPTATA